MSGRRFEAIPELVPFGRNIKELRKLAKLSQEEMAHLAEMDRGYLSGIENGKRNPSTTQLLKIAKALNIPPKTLLDFTAAT